MNIAAQTLPFSNNVAPNQFGWNIVKKPNVAVIITHFNYSELIEPAIDSVLEQTYENVRCVVVDDCSDPKHR
jgi:hypothetical protein